ncbi:Apulose-4-phosphate transketolase subunit B [Fusobacterium sp. DD29]|jgi:transketolase|uniref:transketolase family protein n=1 Tax=unclassified Fusobacterium TaxID=2648384 RepID=UPI001B8CBFA5|nr:MULTISPECIES: transketolase family protein [unclassified Fusobacterium]MBR8749750.1 Apulose-4-phosphate transketolase subunit B [Fusobacterium sp. DD29]MBR8761991.1 Apulose-4-phosphate transketolase subunit B [Fusobacterium sp. DD25]MBR8768029.1 Apulose-4-phosphate transketolase subunit B [Fusobacterium sp. DD43]MBR8772033.1 Apulose-4-phosphate transketolase subunit B [Fusobacterium sp. DD40]MBR8776286.1 Apulose-4-phosphate transketolase subunit B [Fusobacterium sp. DD17]
MSKKSTRQAYGEALVELGKINKDVVVLDADLSGSTKTSLFQKEFPERHFNVGIAEADLMGTAAGFATCGKTVFASTFAMFAAGRAFEQIRNTIAYPKLNVKIAPTHAGISVGEDGGSHESVEDIALMRSIPGMVVLSPADAVETKKMIFAAAEYNGPVYIRMGRLDIDTILPEDYDFQIGIANTLRDGKDVTIAATGLMVAEALKAAETLEKEGISVRVINVGTIKPLDGETILKAAKETKFIITAEEHSVIGGLGSAVSEFLSEVHPTKVKKLGIYDKFGQSGKGQELLEKYELTAAKLVQMVKENM